MARHYRKKHPGAMKHSGPRVAKHAKHTTFRGYDISSMQVFLEGIEAGLRASHLSKHDALMAIEIWKADFEKR